MKSPGWKIPTVGLLVGFLLGACVDAPAPPPSIEATTSAPGASSESPAVKPVERPQGRVKRMPLEDFFPLQQSGDALTYDVRPSFYHALGHIPGSVNWPKSAYTKQLAQREQEIRVASQANRPVVLYCTDLACPDASAIASRLAARGHHIHVLVGGWEAWKELDLPGS